MFHSDLAGIGLFCREEPLDDLEALNESRSALLAHVPESGDAVLGWCLMQPPGTLLSLLAMLVASAVDLTHEKGAPADRQRKAVADTLAQALDVDMRQFWRPDMSYWTRLPRKELLAAFADSPRVLELRPESRDLAIKAHGKLKRDDLADEVAKALDGVGYLPELLLTPMSCGDVELTSAGAHAVAAE
jgi:hypothetical protein